MAKSDGWRSRISDAVTIVLSILAAFALDSWWDNYTLARNVENGIRAVSEELVEVEAHLDKRLTAYDEAISLLSDALAMIQSAEKNQIVQVPDRLMAGALYTPTIDPPTGALSAFIDSGLLAAVTDSELRHRIGELPRRFEDGADDESSALEYVSGNVRPTLERNLSRAHFSAVLSQMWRYWDLFRSDVPWAEPSVSVAVLASP